MKSWRWIRQTAGSQGNVILNLAPGTDGGCIWRLSQATLCRKLRCELSIIHFIISSIRENRHANLIWKYEHSAVKQQLLPNEETVNIKLIQKSERYTPWQNKFTRAYMFRNSLFGWLLCIFGRNVRAIFGHCRQLAIVCATLLYLFAWEHAPKRPVLVRKKLRLIRTVVETIMRP